MAIRLPDKDPSSIEPFHIVWCDKDGTNDGGTADAGELQGGTISTTAWAVPSGITRESDNKNAATIHGVNYAINTVTTIWLSGGSDGVDYELVNTIVTNDGRTLQQTIIIPVRQR